MPIYIYVYEWNKIGFWFILFKLIKWTYRSFVIIEWKAQMRMQDFFYWNNNETVGYGIWWYGLVIFFDIYKMKLRKRWTYDNENLWYLLWKLKTSFVQGFSNEFFKKKNIDKRMKPQSKYY